MKKIISFSLVLMMVLSLFAFAPLTVSAAEKLGTGTVDDPYIVNADNIAAYTEKYADRKWSGYYSITTPVTINCVLLTGGDLYINGNGNTITFEGERTGGLFNVLGDSANANLTVEVSNLKLAGTINSTAGFLGALADKVYSKVTITNVESNVTINSTATSVSGIGGLLGYVYQASTVTINNCVNKGNISGTGSYIGGIVGYARSSNLMTISNSKNTGNISSGGIYLAGLVAFIRQCSLTINGCVNEGAITTTATSNAPVSGLANSGNYSQTINVLNSYNTGVVKNEYDRAACALVYGQESATVNITNCFNIGEISAGSLGGTMANFCNMTGVYNASTSLRRFNEAAGKTMTRVYTIQEVNPNATQDTGVTGVTTAELKLLATTLGDAFETPVNLTKEDAYPYPVLKNNPYKLVIAADEIPTTLGSIGGGFAGEGDISGTYAEGAEVAYNGKYIAAFGNAVEKFGWDITYGVILTDENGTEYKADAVVNSAVKKSGNYGVLFYGAKLIPGSYTLKPYVTYTGFGETNTVYADEISVTVE